MTVKGESTSWILDSGCNFHMCPNIDWLESLIETVGLSFVLLGNNQVCTIKGVGSVRLQLSDGSVRLILEEKRNLVSIGLLERKGYCFESFGGRMIIRKDVVVVMQGERKGSLYYMQASVINIDDKLHQIMAHEVAASY